MSVGADPEDQQVDATRRLDRVFVAANLGLQVRGIPVEEIDPRRAQPDVREEVILHEAAVAPGMRRGDADELIQVERRRGGEIGGAGLRERDELFVEQEGCPSSRETEHERRLRLEGVGHARGESARHLERIRKDRDPLTERHQSLL